MKGLSMSHHGQDPFDAYDETTAERMKNLLEASRRQLSEAFVKSEIGPTGKFPDGKMAKHDEGEIAFSVGARDGKVVLDFGASVAWIGMDPGQAVALAQTLIAHAKKCRLIGQKTPDVRHKATVR